MSRMPVGPMADDVTNATVFAGTRAKHGLRTARTLFLPHASRPIDGETAIVALGITALRIGAEIGRAASWTTTLPAEGAPVPAPAARSGHCATSGLVLPTGERVS